MIGTIIKSAFGFEQVTGGAVGAAILQGIKRGLFSLTRLVWVLRRSSNSGSAHPVKQGNSITLVYFSIQC